MTNFEKLMKDDPDVLLEAVVDGIAFVKGQPKLCSNDICSECDFNGVSRCEIVTKEWLKAEYKEPIKLNEQELKLCEMIGEGYLARGLDGILEWFEIEPYKGTSAWYTVGNGKKAIVHNKKIMGVLFSRRLNFDFVKWEEEPLGLLIEEDE